MLCFYLITILFLLSRLICIYEMYVTLSYFPFEKEIVSVEVYVYGDGSCVGVVWKGIITEKVCPKINHCTFFNEVFFEC